MFSTDRAEQAKCDDCLAAARSTTLRTRTCQTCGAAFTGGPRARYCPTCRAERQKTRERKYQVSGYSRHLGDIDNCVICGGEYVICSGRQKYCPKCAPDYRAKRHKTPRRGVKVCVVCGREIVPGTPTVTCSPECAAAHRKEAQHRADAKRRGGKNQRQPKQKKEKLP